MAQFLITYLGGEAPKTPEEGQKHFAEYQRWLKSMGEAVISPMNPIKHTHTISPDGSVSEGGALGMSGYTIIQADSLEAAIALAKECPFLAVNGSLEVSERIQMSG